MQDLTGELHTASCANANAHKKITRLTKAEVERLRKAGDWLPIESAPRDGSYFIGGVWGDMESRPTWATMCHYYISGKRFEMQETCDQPDFWIPLPNAPKEGNPSV
jgi:hypothetical protein